MKIFRAAAKCSERHACGQLEVLRAMVRYQRREGRFAQANERFRIRLRGAGRGASSLGLPAVSRVKSPGIFAEPGDGLCEFSARLRDAI